MTLDCKRINDNRYDVVPCFKRAKRSQPRKAIVRTLFQKYYVPFLFNKKIEILVYFLSLVLFSLGIVA